MKRTLILCLSALFPLCVAAQSSSAFQFLQLPLSSHAAALGGDNITIADDDHMLAFHNPALLSGTTGGTLGLSYMNYMTGSNLAGASYNVATGGRSALAFGAEYLGFGTMARTDVDGTEMGTFSAKDMALTGVYSYALSDNWSGGVSARFIYSNYDVVYSLALGVDLGLNYYNTESDFSFSLVARQLGGQVKTYDDIHEPLPFNLMAGISKGLAYAPVRFSLTMTDLTRWTAESLALPADVSFKNILFRHLIIGADILPTENTWIAVGYNHRLHSNLTATGARSLAGFSLGGGINLSRIKLGLSYARYHVASNSLSLNLSYAL